MNTPRTDAGRRSRRGLDVMLPVLAIAAYVAAGVLAWFHLTMGPPAQRVNIRWSASVSDAERARAEQTHGLVAGARFEGRTWRYVVRKRSRADIQQLVTDPRVEDTFHIDRAAFRIQLDQPNLSPGARAWLESDRLGQISLVLALAATVMTWWSWSLLTAIALAARRAAYRGATWIEDTSEPAPSNARLAPTWVIVLALTWAVIAIPYVRVGPPDFDEYLTGVASTHVVLDAIVHGAWPFWSLDFGLGVPQPFRYHFIFHPLAPLCLATDCDALLRSITAIHLLLGAVFMTLLARRFTASRVLASAAGLTFCLSSCAVEFMFADDWPMTLIHESAVPIMVYAVLAISDEPDWRHSLLWSLVLGGVAGLILSLTFPIPTLFAVAIIGMSVPGLRRRFPWLVFAAVVTTLMGAAKVHHIYTEVMRNPGYLPRLDHPDYPAAYHLWSAFLRPFPLSPVRPDWRTVFFGPPFAIAATIAAATRHDARIRPILVGLLLGVLGFVIPPSWLFNINTAQWMYRTELNVFGILLAVYGIDRWTSSSNRHVWRVGIVAVQLCWVVVCVTPEWYPRFVASVGLAPPGRTKLISPGMAEEIAGREHASPGRAIFAPEAEAALRLPIFNNAGLAANELPVLGVPTVSATENGITTDDLFPQVGMLESDITATPGMIRSRPLLNVLGIRYVLAYGHDTVAEGLQEVKSWSNGLRMYENSEAWPDAFFVNALRDDRVPRLTGCGHDRFLCADFSKYDLYRTRDSLQITRLRDGFRLTFPPRDTPRSLLITQWYYPEWTVTEGRASLRRAAEQLIGVEVAPGERTVTVQYRPYLRAALFALGLATEAIVGIAILVLAMRPRTATVQGERAVTHV